MSSLTEQRVLEGLSRLAFAGHPVIWWSDPEGEFSELIASLPFAQGDVIALGSVPALAIKRRIALDGAGKVFVLYERGPAPDPENDWLLDIRLYAAPFAADATSMLQQDLGLRSASLRDHLKSRGRFFTSKERTAKLAARIQPEDNARDIDAKIWAVLARSPPIRCIRSTSFTVNSTKLQITSLAAIPMRWRRWMRRWKHAMGTAS